MISATVLINYLAFKGVPGSCTGIKIQSKEPLKCEDVESDDPQCTECQKVCLSQKGCLGFSLDKSWIHRGECFMKKGILIVDANEYTKENMICFKKGDHDTEI